MVSKEVEMQKSTNFSENALNLNMRVDSDVNDPNSKTNYENCELTQIQKELSPRNA